jgi:hypothetical protein
MTGENCFVRQALRHGLGDPEVDDLDDRRALWIADHDIRRFDVAMNDAFLVRVLNGVTNLDEKIEALARAQIVFVAVIGDALALHQFHDEKKGARWPSRRRPTPWRCWDDPSTPAPAVPLRIAR